MKITDIPLEFRYYGNAERTQGREVREGCFDGATEFWCTCEATGKWVKGSLFGEAFDINCGQIWSRPIDVGEGWELVGLDEVETAEMEFWRAGVWIWNSWQVPERTIRYYMTEASGLIRAFRRRKKPEHQPAQSGEWVSVKEKLPSCEDADENGNVLTILNNYSSWVALPWYQISADTNLYWMRQPPTPPMEPAKTDAEAVWERYESGVIATGMREIYLAGYAAGKEAR